MFDSVQRPATSSPASTRRRSGDKYASPSDPSAEHAPPSRGPERRFQFTDLIQRSRRSLLRGLEALRYARTGIVAAGVVQRVPLTDASAFVQWAERSAIFLTFAHLNREDAKGRCADAAASISGMLQDEGYGVQTLMASAHGPGPDGYMNHFVSVANVGGTQIVVDGTMQQFRVQGVEAAPGVYELGEWKRLITSLAGQYRVEFRPVTGGVVSASFRDEKRHVSKPRP